MPRLLALLAVSSGLHGVRAFTPRSPMHASATGRRPIAMALGGTGPAAMQTSARNTRRTLQGTPATFTASCDKGPALPLAEPVRSPDRQLAVPAGLMMMPNLVGRLSPFEFALILNTLLAIWGVLKEQKMLTNTGLINAWILGVVLWTTLGAPGWALCVLYLICGSAVTKVGRKEKEALGIAEGRGGRRGPENVWGSAAAATLCAIASYCLTRRSLTASIVRESLRQGIDLAFVSSLATKLSDTFASEIGKAFGKSTYLITTFQKVPKGTEGAVSLEGTMAGVIGSLIIGIAGWAFRLISGPDILIAIVAAFVATNCESLIGATAQGKVKWMTNEVVNFLNTSIGAAVAIFLWWLKVKLVGARMIFNI